MKKHFWNRKSLYLYILIFFSILMLEIIGAKLGGNVNQWGDSPVSVRYWSEVWTLRYNILKETLVLFFAGVLGYWLIIGSKKN